jgi:hypothetical protein
LPSLQNFKPFYKSFMRQNERLDKEHHCRYHPLD